MTATPSLHSVETLAERLFARDHPSRQWRPALAASPDDVASPDERALYLAFAEARRLEAQASAFSVHCRKRRAGARG